ncbi:hypothetical protein D1003_08440 [Riemerella anatipestifer]|nr:hypothetical protein [Riemerella anatipestifer]
MVFLRKHTKIRMLTLAYLKKCLYTCPQFMRHDTSYIQQSEKKLQNYLAISNNFVNTHTHTHTHTHTQKSYLRMRRII